MDNKQSLILEKNNLEGKINPPGPHHTPYSGKNTPFPTS